MDLEALGKKIKAITLSKKWPPFVWDYADSIIQICDSNDDFTVSYKLIESKRSIPAAIALLHSECSEALEAYRAGDFKNFKEEMADLAIRLIDLCADLSIDLEAEILTKSAINAARPEKHGGKKV